MAPATINRRLSALRSLVALGKEFGYVTFDLATKNVRAEAYRDTRGPEPDIMVLLLEYAKAQPHTGQGGARCGDIPAAGLRPRLATR